MATQTADIVNLRLPAVFQRSINTTLVTQGAEGLLFRTTFLSSETPCALKVRPRKAYRHPTLDVRLTRQRILAEARVLVRCAREGVKVPGVLGADLDGTFLLTV
jgi:TP53 regulating kinase-like protein